MSQLNTPFCTSTRPLSLVGPDSVLSSSSSSSSLPITSMSEEQMQEAVVTIDAKDERCVVCMAGFGKGNSILNPTRLACCRKRLCFPCVVKCRETAIENSRELTCPHCRSPFKGGLTALLSLDHLVNAARNPFAKPYYSAQDIVDYLDQLIASGHFPQEGIPVDVLGDYMQKFYKDHRTLSFGRTSNRNALTEAMRALSDKVERVHKSDCKLSWIVRK